MPSIVDSESSEASREVFVEQALIDYESALIGYAASILHDLDLARDVTQDTFIRLCQQDPAKVRDQLKPWLFKVCRNRSLDMLKKNRREKPLEETQWKNLSATGLQPDEEIEHKENQDRLITYLGRLTDNQREVILLKFQQNLSYREIETITGLSSSNIGFLIHSGIKRLHDILPDELRP